TRSVASRPFTSKVMPSARTVAVSLAASRMPASRPHQRFTRSRPGDARPVVMQASSRPGFPPTRHGRRNPAHPDVVSAPQPWGSRHGRGLALRPCPGNGLPSRKEGRVDFAYSDKVKKLQQQVREFVDAYVYPSERVYFEQLQANRWAQPPIMEELKAKARAAGLWNLFLPDSPHGAGLTNLEHAPLCEIMGGARIASEAL